MRILISAGEASGDLYAARLVEALRRRHPEATFFGCAGPRMQDAGVEPLIDQRTLAVVGIFEILPHLPKLWAAMRMLAQAARARTPDLAILTDFQKFHGVLAGRLAATPVVQLVAPQAWAWRESRVKAMRRNVRRLLCIFPFEEAWFRARGVDAHYIGHPLAASIRPSMTPDEFRIRLGISPAARIVTLVPGSRPGELRRLLPETIQAVKLIRQRVPAHIVLALPGGFGTGDATFREPIHAAGIQIVEGITWDALAHAEIALGKPGTVTMEAALLGTPMVTFYRVNELTWMLGRRLVKAPYLNMVNLVAERRVLAELIQHEMTAPAIAAEALRLLENSQAREAVRQELRAVAAKLATPNDPMDTAAALIEQIWAEKNRHETKAHA